jgi:hypothetical protein
MVFEYDNSVEVTTSSLKENRREILDGIFERLSKDMDAQLEAKFGEDYNEIMSDANYIEIVFKADIHNPFFSENLKEEVVRVTIYSYVRD